MTAEKQSALQTIEEKKSLITGIADKIWGFAELSLQEFKSAETYCEALEKEGFEVERGTSNIETAFAASYGHGRPYIGILAEYDALSGLSQEAGATERKEIHVGGNGHGCGHNILGAGAFAAALGVKAYLEKNDISGTVILYGCPGEEGGAAKAFMRVTESGKNSTQPLPGIRKTSMKLQPVPPTPVSRHSTSLQESPLTRQEPRRWDEAPLMQ